MAFRVSIFGLQLYSLCIQKVQQAGSSILETNTGKIGCTFTILGSELELNVTVLRPRIAHKSVLNVLESQENRLLILGKLRIAIGSACHDSSANSSSVKKGPIDI